MSNVKSCQFLSDSKDLNDHAFVFHTGNLSERGKTWQVESGASLYVVLRIKPAAQNKTTAAREPA